MSVMAHDQRSGIPSRGRVQTPEVHYSRDITSCPATARRKVRGVCVEPSHFAMSHAEGATSERERNETKRSAVLPESGKAGGFSLFVEKSRPEIMHAGY